MQVVITKEHVDNGSYTDPWGCPLFLALKEQGVAVQSVGGDGIATINNEDVQFINEEGEPWDFGQYRKVLTTGKSMKLTGVSYSLESMSYEEEKVKEAQDFI